MTEIQIYINRETFQSPKVTTGLALYELGQLDKHQELFREIKGDQEEPPVPRDATEIHLVNDEHFFSEKIVTIIIEGAAHKWPKEQMISYEQVVKLEVPDYPNGKTYSVKYKNGPVHYHEGPLVPGGKVKVKGGMIFNVSETGQS